MFGRLYALAESTAGSAVAFACLGWQGLSQIAARQRSLRVDSPAFNFILLTSRLPLLSNHAFSG